MWQKFKGEGPNTFWNILQMQNRHRLAYIVVKIIKISQMNAAFKENIKYKI